MVDGLQNFVLHFGECAARARARGESVAAAAEEPAHFADIDLRRLSSAG